LIILTQLILAGHEYTTSSLAENCYCGGKACIVLSAEKRCWTKMFFAGIAEYRRKL